MPYLNVEIKARCQEPARIRNYLELNQAEFRGMDEQTDTYFHTNGGRLKLREGHIENNLIYYERGNQVGPKQSQFMLVKVEDAQGLKQALEKSNGIKVVVKKKREIYYIRNVKFHLDTVPGLGTFVEIEAGNLLLPLTTEQLREQCDFYMDQLGIQEADLIELSYSDLLLDTKTGKEEQSFI
ncbi:MAG TPA: class IV adenylate cyclase [Chitinophagaceae bacterium]|nr:class IV adenylate cyclase [Chitinophagaceae bacterium]